MKIHSIKFKITLLLVVTDTTTNYQNNEKVTKKSSNGGTVNYADSSVSLVATKYRIYDEDTLRASGALDNMTFDEYVAANSDPTPITVDQEYITMISNATGIPTDKITIIAPEDQSMQQELDKMGEGQRSQIAVTMLVTGMYLNMSDVGGGGKKPSLDMGAALNSFLQSEINNIAGSALKSVDITLGMEQYDQNGTGSGGERTDFSFRFAKRFKCDRCKQQYGSF